jgi:hypothetical protein
MQADANSIQKTAQRYCKLLEGSTPALSLLARQNLLKAVLDEVILDGANITITSILPVRGPYLEHQNRPQRVDDWAARVG